jgi:hypothetical protein
MGVHGLLQRQLHLLDIMVRTYCKGGTMGNPPPEKMSNVGSNFNTRKDPGRLQKRYET